MIVLTRAHVYDENLSDGYALIEFDRQNLAYWLGWIDQVIEWKRAGHSIYCLEVWDDRPEVFGYCDRVARTLERAETGPVVLKRRPPVPDDEWMAVDCVTAKIVDTGVLWAGYVDEHAHFETDELPYDTLRAWQQSYPPQRKERGG